MNPPKPESRVPHFWPQFIFYTCLALAGMNAWIRVITWIYPG
jgi:hypothetical protein